MARNLLESMWPLKTNKKIVLKHPVLILKAICIIPSPPNTLNINKHFAKAISLTTREQYRFVISALVRYILTNPMGKRLESGITKWYKNRVMLEF